MWYALLALALFGTASSTVFLILALVAARRYRRYADNAALGVVDELRALYPNVKCRIVLSGPPTWPNAKVFSLDKMIALSRNDYFVVSDSDVEVGPDFLRTVVPPLLDPRNGLLTCVYRGVPARSFWSSL